MTCLSPPATCFPRSACFPSLGLTWRCSLPSPISLQPEGSSQFTGEPWAVETLGVSGGTGPRCKGGQLVWGPRRERLFPWEYSAEIWLHPASGGKAGSQYTRHLLQFQHLGSPEVVLGLHSHSLWATDLWGPLHPTTLILTPRGTKSYTCSASSGPWQGFRVTAFRSCPLASPAAVRSGQLG